MHDTKSFAPCRRQLRPVPCRFLQQAICTENVCLDEGRCIVDGTVDMGFSSQMHDRHGSVALENAADLGSVADIDVLELVAWIVRNGCEGIEIARVRELVHIDDNGISMGQKVTYQCRADEARAA